MGGMMGIWVFYKSGKMLDAQMGGNPQMGFETIHC